MLSESTVKVCTSPFFRKTFLILSSYLASAHTDCLNLFLKNFLLRFAVSEVHYKLFFRPVNTIFNFFKKNYFYIFFVHYHKKRHILRGIVAFHVFIEF